MEKSVRFASRFCRFTAWYGIVLLVPQLFLETKIGIDQPPAINHPEFFYGFTGVALAWQVAFLILAGNPQGFRPLFLPAALEKFSFGLAVFALYALGRVSPLLLGFAGMDLLFGVGFLHCYRKLGVSAA